MAGPSNKSKPTTRSVAPRGFRVGVSLRKEPSPFSVAYPNIPDFPVCRRWVGYVRRYTGCRFSSDRDGSRGILSVFVAVFDVSFKPQVFGTCRWLAGSIFSASEPSVLGEDSLQCGRFQGAPVPGPGNHRITETGLAVVPDEQVDPECILEHGGRAFSHAPTRLIAECFQAGSRMSANRWFSKPALIASEMTSAFLFPRP